MMLCERISRASLLFSLEHELHVASVRALLILIQKSNQVNENMCVQVINNSIPAIELL